MHLNHYWDPLCRFGIPKNENFFPPKVGSKVKKWDFSRFFPGVFLTKWVFSGKPGHYIGWKVLPWRIEMHFIVLNPATNEFYWVRASMKKILKIGPLGSSVGEKRRNLLRTKPVFRKSRFFETRSKIPKCLQTSEKTFKTRSAIRWRKTNHILDFEKSFFLGERLTSQVNYWVFLPLLSVFPIGTRTTEDPSRSE